METDNAYQPPQAELGTQSALGLKYYVVAKRKFYLLSILTFCLYLVYWFYKNFSRIRAHTGEKMWPVMRGLFSIFFAHNLCNRVDADLKDNDTAFQWTPGVVATLYILCTIGTNVLNSLSSRYIGSPFTDVLSLVLLILTAVVLFPAQEAINVACDDPDGSANAKLSGANWIWMVLGGLVWLGVLFGVAVMIFAPELLAE